MGRHERMFSAIVKARLSWLFVAMVLALSAVPLPALCQEASEETLAADPAALRLGPFIQSVLGGKATVLWFSDGDKPGTVKYGLAADKLDRTATSVARAIPPEVKAKGKFAHEALLTDLPAGKDVYYRLTDPADPVGTACFRSDPGAAGTITVIAAGDEIYFDAYLPFLKARGIRPDMFIDLGDYQSRVHRYGRPWWRNVPSYIAWGSHNDAQTEKHLWALPGNKITYAFDFGPAFFAFRRPAQDVKTQAAWKVLSRHEPVITNGKGGGFNVKSAVAITKAGYDLFCAGHVHRYDRSYPINGERRALGGTVFLTHGGRRDDTNAVQPAISNYYRCEDSVVVLPILTFSPDRFELRTLVHTAGDFLPDEARPKDWPEKWGKPKDFPHEWDYYVRVKDPQYAAGKVAALRPAVKAGQTDAETTATVRELGGLGEPAAAQPLMALLKIAKDATLRREIALALDRIGDPAAMAAMKTLDGDDDVMTRVAVARFFAKFGKKADAPDLAALAEDDRDAGGNCGPTNVSPRKYLMEGLMLRIGGATAYRLAPDLLAVDGHYAGCVLKMVTRDPSGTNRLAILRSLADWAIRHARFSSEAAGFLAALGPVADGPKDVERLVRLASKSKGKACDALAVGLARNGAKQHVGLLVGGYRRTAGRRHAADQALTIRKALKALTGLELPDPGAGRDDEPDPAKVEEGAKMVDQWIEKTEGTKAGQ